MRLDIDIDLRLSGGPCGKPPSGLFPGGPVHIFLPLLLTVHEDMLIDVVLPGMNVK